MLTKIFTTVDTLTSVSDDTITLHYEGEAINPNHDDISLFDEHIITSGESTSKDSSMTFANRAQKVADFAENVMMYRVAHKY